VQASKRGVAEVSDKRREIFAIAAGLHVRRRSAGEAGRGRSRKGTTFDVALMLASEFFGE
jgi:hypothetical protein